MADKYYVDTRAMGQGFIINKTSGFFAREAIGLDKASAEGIKQLENNFLEVQKWLGMTYANLSRRDFELEVPAHIKDILCLAPEEVRKEEQPSRKATVAGSSRKSQKKPTKKASSTSTKAKTQK